MPVHPNANAFSPGELVFIQGWGNGLRTISGYLDELHRVWDEAHSLFKEDVNRAERLALIDGLSWARWYELPDVIALRLLCALLAPTAMFESIAQRSRLLARPEGKSDRPFFWRRLNMRVFGPLSIALDRTIQSFLIHQQTVNSLVSRVRGGDSDAFFDAIGIDPASLAAKPMRKRLARAVFEHDSSFLNHLANTLKAPSKREDFRETARLNASMAFMAMVRQLDKVKSADMAYELFVVRAGVYKSAKANISAKENLWALVSKAQRQHRKRKREEKSS